MYRQNYQDIYNRYISQFPELNYNLCDPDSMYESQLLLPNSDYSELSGVENEGVIEYPSEPSKETYNEWIQENVIQRSQNNIIRTEYTTEYEQSSQTFTKQYHIDVTRQTNDAKPVSRRYLDKFYENTNYNSEGTSETRTSISSEMDDLVDEYESTEKSDTYIKNEIESKSSLGSKVNNIGTEDHSLAEDLKETINNVLIESRLQRFDRLVTAELKRQRDSEHIMLEPVTSDVELIKAVNHLAHAESADMFNGAVKAAEEAAAKASPEKAEEAAVAGAKEYQAEVTDFINQSLDGWTPIKVIGYVGITKPKLPTKS